MTTPKKRKAANAGERAAFQTTSSVCILSDLLADIKARLLAGELVAAADYPSQQRPHYHAAISELRDVMGIHQRWRTKTESAVGDWRLRQRCYYLTREYVTRPGDRHE